MASQNGDVLGSSPTTGSVNGKGLGAVLCSGGSSATVQSTNNTSYNVPFLFNLGPTFPVDGGSPISGFAFQSPPGARDGTFDILVGLDALDAGVVGDYLSPSAQSCGFAVFSFYLPPATAVDCDAGTSSGCPLGCTAACSHFSCTPCQPKLRLVSYGAQGSSDCAGNAQVPVGSWHLSLTSVDWNDAGSSSGRTSSAPHGSFSATLVDGEDGGATATVSATF